MRQIPSRRFGLLVAFAAVALTAVANANPPPRFPAGSVWHQNIANSTVHPQSASMLTALADLGGWGNGNRFQIDRSFHVRHLAPGENPPRYPVVQRIDPDPNPELYYLQDCEPLGTTMPVPADAAFEGQAGLTCPNLNGDCHLLVREGNLLYELYAGNLQNNQLDALCLAIWDLGVIYPPEGRGDHCTSADAAGFPIAPLLPNADEVAAALLLPDGDLGHAIRFVLPNARMASDNGLGGEDGKLYVRPATHAGNPFGPADSVPYGVRMRLRSGFNMTGYNAAAQVILRTMQRFGIVLSDGGNIALTFETDDFTTTKWEADLGIDNHVFWNGSAGNRTPVLVTDFEVIDTGPRIPETYNCVRTAVVPGDTIFSNGFEQ